MNYHPCYDRCYRLYRNAITDWHANAAIQQAAETLGMNARAYADARLTANQFQWTDANTDRPFTREDADRAYRAAANDVCGVSA